jgi:cbb3-type cytochrome oxidase subunit 3
MDVNDLRVAITLASLALFVALMLHTWSRRRRAEHDEAAMLPFAEEPADPPAAERAFAPGANPTRGENT